MGGKKEAREARKALRAKRDARKIVKLQVSLANEKTPRVEVLAEDVKRVAVVASLADLSAPKQVREAKGGSRFGLQMTWCARKSDQQDSWEWGEPRKWGDEEWGEEIHPGMNALEQLPWEEIQKQTSDTSHLLHHDHQIVDLCDDAQLRWLELGYEQFDVIFRFRLGNTKRAWGLVVQAHFYLIWWERYHKIFVPRGDR